MNKIALSILSVGVFTITMQAQNTFPNNGNVGVGTMNPNSKLEVNGETTLKGDLDVKEDALLEKELQVEGNATIKGQLEVGELASMKKGMEVYGDVIFDDLKSLSNGNIPPRMLMIDRDGKVIVGNPWPGTGGGGMGGAGGSSGIQKCFSVDLSPANLIWYGPGQITQGLTEEIYHLCGNTAGEDYSINVPGTVYANDANFNFDVEIDGDLTVNGNINYSGASTPSFNKLKIGTLEPSNHTNYTLAVDGKAVFKEAVVTEVNWADFVFDDNYKLKPLNEVEKFITKNHHLPDVPSEKEVTENGVSVGDMDAILLQKIEELTLYVIEQDKKIKALESKLNE